jgi:Asp-tRNA(Asn)/Glu-tRNA(Gln) amidotransferase A subunit family amidase
MALAFRLGYKTGCPEMVQAAISNRSIRPDGLPFGIALTGRCGSDLQLAQFGQRDHHAAGLTHGHLALRRLARVSRVTA